MRLKLNEAYYQDYDSNQTIWERDEDDNEEQH